MIRRTTFALLMGAALPCAAQERTLEPGDVVRVVAPAHLTGPLRGEVVRYLADTLTVRDPATDSVHAIPMYAIRTLARSHGVQPSWSLHHGMRVGAFLGTSAGLVMGPMLARMGEENHFLQTTALSGAAGLLGGTALGALAGALFPREHWQRYGMARTAPPPPPVRTPQAAQ
jgi:hypothetical protein